MQKISATLANIYYSLRCAWIIAWRCLLVIFRANFGGITHPEMNQIVKQASTKIFKLTHTKYTITYTHALHFTDKVPYIFMSNHQSLLDIPLIYASMEGTIRFIAKKELFKIPLFGKMLAISECIPIDRSKPAHTTNFYPQVKEKLSNNIFLWIFPEGTRSKTGELLTFKSGGFRLAQEVSAKIIPVGISNTRTVLPPGKFTFKTNQTASIRVGKPFDTKDYQGIEAQKVLIEKVRQAIDELST